MKIGKKQLWSVGLSVLTLCLASPAAHAGSASSSFGVSAAVAATCSISTVNMAFGNYDPVTANATTPLTVNGSVTVTCTKGSQVWIDLNPGTHAASASGTTRAMQATTAGGPEYLSYELYSDNTYSTVWGVGNPSTGGNGYAPAPAANKNPRAFSIYGRIPAGQDSAVGNYSDTVQATVNF